MINRVAFFSFLFVLYLLPVTLGASGDARTLSFYHTHTGKSLEVTYFEDGGYRADGMKQIRSFLADWRNGAEKDIDPALMDILWQIHMKSRHMETWEVISAYRSPETNNLLRSRSSGVARNSQHVPGKAIDVRLRDLRMIHSAKLGHIGGEFSATDILVTLFFGGVLRYDPTAPNDPERDRFVLSKGHSAAALYTTLAMAGYFDEDGFVVRWQSPFD